MSDKQEQIDDLYDHWAAAGGTAAHAGIKKHLYKQAKKLGVTLPGMPGQGRRS